MTSVTKFRDTECLSSVVFNAVMTILSVRGTHDDEVHQLSRH